MLKDVFLWEILYDTPHLIRVKGTLNLLHIDDKQNASFCKGSVGPFGMHNSSKKRTLRGQTLPDVLTEAARCDTITVEKHNAAPRGRQESGGVRMSKKWFVVSDVHGHYSILMEALARVGFDATDEEHVFVSCGDLFDRGGENARVYEFVRSLPRKILIRGNHEDMLLHSLRDGCLTEAAQSNGTDQTVLQLLGPDTLDIHGCIVGTACRDKVAQILALGETMVDYCELGDYILTHGWIPVIFEGRYPHIAPDWRDAPDEDWEFARWLAWEELYDIGATVRGKTIVCGHHTSRLGYRFDPSRATDCYDIFYGDGVIAIDSGTVMSGVINVLVLEDIC